MKTSHEEKEKRKWKLFIIPRKRVSCIARSKVGMKKEVRLRRRSWKNHGEVFDKSSIIMLQILLRDKKD